MPTTAGLGNSADWQFVIGEGRSSDNGHIPKYSVPVQFSQPLIAVRVESASAKDNWFFAGNIFQEVRLGIVVGGEPDAIASGKRVWLNQLSLFSFRRLSSSYTLSYKPPFWLRDCIIYTWEYSGVVPVLVGEDSTVIMQQLAEIEQKLNTLL